MAKDLISKSKEWQALATHCEQVISKTHLKNLLQDADRCKGLFVEFDGVLLDFSRQRVTEETLNLLFDLADKTEVKRKIDLMASGGVLNTSEQRAVMHAALRAAPTDEYKVGSSNVVPDVIAVRNKIQQFSDKVRSGTWKGATGQTLKDVVAIGIGGSYLGGEFVAESLKFHATAKASSAGRRLRFLANVDPVDVARALDGLDPATTLAIVVSKTFTTAETMLNARTVRQWFVDKLGPNATSKHMVAVSTNIDGVKQFGIDDQNIFGFWDWVGGRYSVTSAVGLLPLALQYGYPVVDEFLKGCRSVDQHFFSAPPRQNLPVLLGLLGVWNSNFLGHPTRALACYSQALHKFAPHIQQVDMESNGKRVTSGGKAVDYTTGEINFGEPGTNGQHSFFQLFHQGRTVPVDFIGFCKSQNPVELKDEPVPNHDELMSNFFAQPDALACGKSADELQKEDVHQYVIPHKVMPGNRPSNVLLLPELSPYTVGQLLALYEHRTAVQGFVWGINSFDQMGVELGKVLAKQVRSQLQASRKKGAPVSNKFNPSTVRLLQRYLQTKL